MTDGKCKLGRWSIISEMEMVYYYFFQGKRILWEKKPHVNSL